MKRLCLGFILACAAAGASADWTLVGGSSGVYSAYADRESAQKTPENHVRMWTLYDFSMTDYSATGHRHQSTAALRDYDCDGARVRLVSFVDYAENMGGGKIISSNGDPSTWQPRRWEPVVSGAVDEALLKVACGR